MKKLIITTALSVAVLGMGYSGFAQAKPVAKTPIHWNTDPLQDSHKVDYKSLPEPAKTAIHKRINAKNVEDVDKGMLHGRVVYEVAYKKDKKSDKTYELRVTPDGRILGEHGD